MHATNKDKILKQETLILKSDPQEISKVEQMLERLCKKVTLSNERCDNVAIAVSELVNNAILHGNKKMSEKTVTVQVTYYKNRVKISVKDEGIGFNPVHLKDPRDPENLWKASGRGIFLVRNLTDEVQFHPSPDGMEITIIEYYDK